MNAIKQAWNLYKKIKYEEKQKTKLIKSPLDGNYLQGLLNEVTNNVEIEVHLKTGEKVILRKPKQEERIPFDEKYTKYIVE